MLIGIDASRAFETDKTGTENYSYELLKVILKLPASRQHRFRLYVKSGAKIEEKQFLDNQRVEIVVIKWPRLWTQAGLAWEVFKTPPQVLWIPAHTLPLIRKPTVKTVVTIHGLEYEYLPEYYRFPQKLWLNKSTEYAVAKADRLIAVSRFTKQQLVKRLGADGDKIKVIYEGVAERFLRAKNSRLSTDYRRQIRHKYGLEKKYILFIGTIQPRKNLQRLIKAWSLIAEQLPDYQLAIGGKEGWMSKEIYQQPEQSGIADRVRFIGRVAEPDLVAVYKGASLFVWPSLMEGFGLPILEAMTMGIPVVTSNRGALPEVAGTAALLINPLKEKEIAEAIKLVLTNEDLAQGLREKGFGQVKKFSFAQAGKETLRVLEEAFWTKKC